MDLDKIFSSMKKYQKDFDVHQKMFDIYEGNLCKHLDKFMARELSPKAASLASWRKCPINIQKKIVDKLSTIYQQPVSRTIPNGTDTDENLLSYYVDNMHLNQVMNNANEFFNMSRSTLLQPYAHLGKPKIRAVPNDRFFVYSDDEVDPLNVTHVIVSGEEIETGADKLQTFYIYTDDQFIVVDSEGSIRKDLMEKFGNPEGINPFGRIPFVYVNRSANIILPPADLDFLQMTMLIPALLTDLNFASCFTLFSIMYGIDVEDQDLELSPNAFWKFKSDPDTDKTPTLGTIKNESDVTEVLELVRSQLAFWLESRSISGGTVGDVNASNFASGISKLIDESDTTDDKKKQIVHFKQAEDDLWNLIINHMHPVWSGAGKIDNRLKFSMNAKVETKFVDPIPMVKKGEMVNDLKNEVESGFLTKKRAIQQLNPDKSEAWVEQLLEEIEQEKMINFRETA